MMTVIIVESVENNWRFIGLKFCYTSLETFKHCNSYCVIFYIALLIFWKINNALAASPFDTFPEIVSLIPNYASSANRWMRFLPWS